MKILLDTNVLLHRELGEQLLIKLIEEGMIPVATDYILDEVSLNLEERFSNPQESRLAFNTLRQIFRLGGEVKEWHEYAQNLAEASLLIHQKDAPVLATAMLPDIDFLLTLDRKHFLNNKRLKSTNWMEKIKKPEDFLSMSP
jgi:predicted nucleic acid-binding protein